MMNHETAVYADGKGLAPSTIHRWITTLSGYGKTTRKALFLILQGDFDWTQGERVSNDGLLHLRHIHPFPRNLGDILGSFDKVFVPELNSGQLLMLLRARYLVNAKGINKMQGQPFQVGELVARIEEAF